MASRPDSPQPTFVVEPEGRRPDSRDSMQTMLTMKKHFVQILKAALCAATRLGPQPRPRHRNSCSIAHSPCPTPRAQRHDLAPAHSPASRTRLRRGRDRQYIAAVLAKIPDIEVQTAHRRHWYQGRIARQARAGDRIAADMDALPVEERNDLPFRSKSKAMRRGQEVPVAHVCGHDTRGHAAGCGPGAWRCVPSCSGTVVFLFQPAEEIGLATVPAAHWPWSRPACRQPEGRCRAGPAHRGRSRPGLDLLSAWRDAGQHRRVQHQAQAVPAGTEQPLAANSPMLASGDHAGPAEHRQPSTNPTIDGGATVVTVGMLQSGNRQHPAPRHAELSGTVRALSAQNQKVAHEQIRMKADHRGLLRREGRSAHRHRRRLWRARQRRARHPGPCRRTEGRGGQDKVAEILPSMGSEDFGAFGATGVPVVFWILNASVSGSRRPDEPLGRCSPSTNRRCASGACTDQCDACA